MNRVLIVDDDPISLRFLEAAATQCGCVATTAANGTTALSASGVFDLLLIDRHLPDIGGADLLHALRARGVGALAVATSAEIDAATATKLRGSGFADVLEKPATLEQIRDLLARHLPATVLDDDAALAATGGDPTAMHALRGLLAQELAELESELAGMSAAALGERLHRLRASCGFCGAPVLAAAAAKLETTLRERGTASGTERKTFLDACRDTMAALRA